MRAVGEAIQFKFHKADLGQDENGNPLPYIPPFKFH